MADSGNGPNAILRASAQISRAIMRAASADEAYRATCRILVESGVLDLAWLGQLDRDRGRIQVVAQAGPAGLADIGAAPASRSAPPWITIRRGVAVVCNDVADGASWPGRDAAISAGFHAMACLPLREADRVTGVLALYSRERHRFDDRTVDLLGAIVDDLAFALGHSIQEQQQGLAAATRVHYLAYYNPETGLPNRALFNERLRELALSQPFGRLSVFSIKLVRLERAARVFGSAAIEELVRTLARRLEHECTSHGEDATIAQVAPDEFALAVADAPDHAPPAALAQRIAGALSAPVCPAGSAEVLVGVSIGIARFPDGETGVDQLLSRARTAAAHSGADTVSFYGPELDRDMASRLLLEAELHHALERHEFELEYQPQLSLRTGAIVGVEALLRWRHPTRGRLAPADFIATLESCGLMPRVGAWALRAACAQNQAWVDAGLPPVRMGVNVSSQQMTPALPQLVREALRDSRMDPALLELELTESVILDDAERAIVVMNELRSLGVGLALDDFGTGYSSMSYLRRLPIDRLKIDQSFIRDVASDAGSATLVRAILAMADSLGLATVAEGVEHEAQLGYLRRHGCREMQGFLYSAALQPGDMATLLRQDRKLTNGAANGTAGSTVLVVDDDPGIQSALKRVLRRDGITALIAPTPGEALELLAKSDVGVVLCGQRMPGMCGAEFLSKVWGMYPDSIRILLTGYTEVTALIDAVNRGAVSKILTKPWEDDQLLANVAEALRQYEATIGNRRLSRRFEEMRVPTGDSPAERSRVH